MLSYSEFYLHGEIWQDSMIDCNDSRFFITDASIALFHKKSTLSKNRILSFVTLIEY